MEPNRPHSISRNSSNSNTTTNELFLCFTSRLSSSSSSSMKISKSILSPGRSARDPSPHQISLSSSLSRRLKTNGSLKGGQSPMFPTSSSVKKKSAAGFENPEPSSPKVTCIGQVRVKSKKKKKNHNHGNNNNNIRSRSHRKSGDYSFRRIDINASGFNDDGNSGLKRQSSTAYTNREIELESSQRHGHNNQKWVHIPVTICESLRSFGADFNCFQPCRSSDREQQRGQVVKGNGEHGSSCGSVLARWLVAVQEGEGGEKGRQIELVVGGEEDASSHSQVYNRRSYRKRHVLEDIDILEIEKDLNNKIGCFDRDEVVEGGRVSICVPPKNALLLMRCGSDPVKMAALANRFWEPPEKDHDHDPEPEEDEKHVHQADVETTVFKECETEPDSQSTCCAMLAPETEESMADEMTEIKREDDNLCDKFVTEEMYEDDVLEEKLSLEIQQAVNVVEDDDMEIAVEHLIVDEDAENESGKEAEADQLVTSPSSEREVNDEVDREEQSVAESESETEEEKKETAAALPECLLLMMCEPKLSMEVSQETWVCSTDFIRWLPPREVKKNKNESAGDELSKRVSIHYKPPTAPPCKAAENQQFVPPRSSCSYPAPPAKQESACESLYLTRCKSEPRRTAAKLAAAVPEGCFWKMEPRAPLGVGAAGVGF
ncbi:unnamed protein product [Rhodiola kirilowii]